MKRFLLALAMIPLMLAVGCGGSTSVKVNRLAETHGGASERIVILVSRYSREGTPLDDLVFVEQTIEQCVQRFAKRHTLLSAAEFRELLAADTTPSDITSKSPEQFLQSLQEPTIEAVLGEANVRFVVLVEGSYGTSEAQWDSFATRGGFGVGAGWTQDAVLTATVLDVKHTRIAGSINFHSKGEEGAGAVVLIIIPVPIYFTSAAESRACGALGKELVRFISE